MKQNLIVQQPTEYNNFFFPFTWNIAMKTKTVAKHIFMSNCCYETKIAIYARHTR